MRVVKIGGSLADWDRLPELLGLLADRGIVIVPGGGPFADQVRRTQQRWQFDDATAHAMALLAMGQFGRLLAGIESRLCLAATLPDLRTHTARGRTSVWLPQIEELAHEHGLANWDVTSDSLGVWLANRLDAAELTLVKSVPWPEDAATWHEFGERGIVDRAFARFATAACCPIRICYREDYCQSGADGAPDYRPASDRPSAACR